MHRSVRLCALVLPCLLTACSTALRRDLSVIDFGDVLVGGSSAPRLASWTNTDAERTAAVVGESVDPNRRGAFGVLQPSPHAVFVPPGESHPVTLAFAPPHGGDFHGTARLVLQDETRRARSAGIRLEGRGLSIKHTGWHTGLSLPDDSPGWFNLPWLDPPAGGRTRPWLEFGSKWVGVGQPIRHHLDVVNTAAFPIEYELAWTRAEPSFTLVEPASPTLVVAGNSRERIVVDFDPRAVGRFDSALRVTPVSPDPGTFQPPAIDPWVGVHVSGRGVAPPAGQGERER